MHGRLVVAVVAAIAVAAVGCGGSAGGDSSAHDGHEFSVEGNTTATISASLTKAKFVAHVNSLCKRKWPFILHAFREYRGDLGTSEPRLSNTQRFVKATRLAYFASIGFHIFDEAHRLGAAPGQKRAVEEVLGSMKEGIERGQRQRPVTSRAQVKALFAEYNRLAHRYGLDECLVTGRHLPHGQA
jgi:hypothetical protein